MELLYDIGIIGIYSILGIVLMAIGNWILDLVIPCHFPTEIKAGNQAVGWLSAGSFIGIGYILRTIVMSPATEVVEESLLGGIVSSAIYFVVAVFFFLLSYMLISLFNKEYNFNEEIGKGNVAAGIMVFGIFVGVAFIISGVIA